MNKPAAITEPAEGPLPLTVNVKHHEIVNFLALLGYGQLLTDLGEARLDLEHAIANTLKAGEITIKIKSAPDGHNKRVLSYEVKIKKPVLPSRTTYVFATEQGQYTETNPEQPNLPLNVTQMAPPAVRVVGG